MGSFMLWALDGNVIPLQSGHAAAVKLRSPTSYLTVEYVLTLPYPRQPPFPARPPSFEMDETNPAKHYSDDAIEILLP